ncbi:MAG: hypothetical protein ACK4TG_05670 [Thermaurantiacus sp.]
MVAEVRASKPIRAVHEALRRAGLDVVDPAYRRERGCPLALLEQGRERDYRLERFTGRDGDNLRGKLVDWLAVVEALGRLLGREPWHQVARFLADVQDERHAASVRAMRGDLAEPLSTLFDDLADDLRRICADVFRRHAVDSFYLYAEMEQAQWYAGQFLANDGAGLSFSRSHFPAGEWSGPAGDWMEEGPRAPGQLDPVGNILVRVPLARRHALWPRLRAEPQPGGPAGDGWPESAGELSLEVEILLVLRADVVEPDAAGAFLIHPFIGWTPAGTAVAEASGPGQCAALPIWPPDDDRARLGTALGEGSTDWLARLAIEHAGDLRIEPITAESCEKWLSLGCGNMDEAVEALIADRRVDGPDVPPVPAPPFTLAAHIQRNLTIPDDSAQVEERLDRLLDRAAAARVASARTYLERNLREWRDYRERGPGTSGSGSSALPPLDKKEGE